MAKILQLSAFLLYSVSVRGQGILEPRNPYYGGYALPGSVDSGAVNGCPADTLTCGDPDNNALQFCCPEFTFCGPTQLGGYCCPTSEDCGPLLSAGATCANPSWNLYEDAFIWCCTPNDVGLALGDGECLTTALTYSNYASTLVQANTASPPTNWPGGTVPPGVSTHGGTTSTASTAAQTTKASTGTQAASTSTTTSTSAASPTGKTSVGSSVEHSYSLAVGALVFAGSLLGAMWL